MSFSAFSEIARSYDRGHLFSGTGRRVLRSQVAEAVRVREVAGVDTMPHGEGMLTFNYATASLRVIQTFLAEAGTVMASLAEAGDSSMKLYLDLGLR